MAEAVQLKSREETACSRNHFPPNKDTTYINIYIYTECDREQDMERGRPPLPKARCCAGAVEQSCQVPSWALERARC